jgi:hypothetical protein
MNANTFSKIYFIIPVQVPFSNNTPPLPSLSDWNDTLEPNQLCDYIVICSLIDLDWIIVFFLFLTLKLKLTVK